MIQKNMINKYVLYAQIETLSNAMALNIVSQAQREKRGQGENTSQYHMVGNMTDSMLIQFNSNSMQFNSFQKNPYKSIK